MTPHERQPDRLPATHDSNTKADSAIDVKARLEAEKLQMELQELKRPLLFRPAYLSAILPTCIGIGTLLILWNKGYFDAQSAALTAQTATLELRKESLRKEVDEFTARSAALNDKMQTLNARVAETSQSLSQKEAQLAQVNKDLAVERLASTVQSLENASESLDVLGVQYSAFKVVNDKHPARADFEKDAIEKIRRALSQDAATKEAQLVFIRDFANSASCMPAFGDVLKQLLAK